jgi:hypothetical protein
MEANFTERQLVIFGTIKVLMAQIPARCIPQSLSHVTCRVKTLGGMRHKVRTCSICRTNMSGKETNSMVLPVSIQFRKEKLPQSLG